ncbi:hypothetical protein CYLTODRAFT_389216 [Cylindrobasidium torrendii FP15055 ss-10]|uniref:PIG-F-domain-containing protein n=1 Tax=Cylindrobasidium torrendii FP15055 ss-10 TaxID=1314674 RepID=A0A0D7BNJ1_9AGAR|nr:hypothetical protein CYLTODRAFT_389216 [Cylindrobasidium torrendii FP15055 ss-10]
MVKSKSKSKKVANNPQDVAPEEEAFFPYARYTSIVGVHTSLLIFVALYFPRMFELADSDQASSLDRPQHPFLRAITGLPAVTVGSICLGACVLQSWWGGWMRDWLIDYSLKGTEESKKLDRKALDDSKTKVRILYLQDAWLATFGASVVFHCVAILFGAPLKHYFARTYVLSLLVSILAVFTPAYAYGIPNPYKSEGVVIRMTWVRLFAEFSIRNPVERAIVYPSVGALLGCWIGVVPIALDWDRPWQAWPLTPAYGAILGFVFASLAALTVNAITSLAMEDILYERQQEKSQ